MKQQCMRFNLIALAAFALVLPACETDGNFTFLGYSSRPNYDPGIQTVRVPIFQNETYRKGLEFRATEAVIREIEAKTPFKVVPASSPADTELIGRIVNRNKSLINLNQLAETREAQTTLSVEVQWRDIRPGQMGDVLSNPLPPDPSVPPIYKKRPPSPKVLVQSMWSFRPELGESLVSAEKTMVDRLALRIVHMMELPW